MNVKTNEEPKQKYGFYSAEAVARGDGTSFYRTPDGGEVEVTAVFNTKNPQYSWPDKFCVGQVTKWLRVGQIDNIHRKKR